MDNGWMPGIDRQPSPNIIENRGGFTLLAMVIHIMAGSFQTSINWMRKAGTSSTFAVRKDGYTVQLVSLDDGACANGLTWLPKLGCWQDPDRNLLNRITPPWPLLTPPVNPNLVTGSIEHDGQSGELFTEAMYAADAAILQYVGQRHALVWVPHVTLIGHCEIGPIHRSRCPGSGVDLARLAELGNQRPAARGTYNVIVDSVRIRCAPAAGETPIAGKLTRGAMVAVDTGKAGSMVAGSNLWLHLADGRGFVHNSCVEQVA